MLSEEMKNLDFFAFIPKNRKWSDACFAIGCLFAFLSFSNVFSLQGYLVLPAILFLLIGEALYDSFRFELNFPLLIAFGLTYCFFSWLNGLFDPRQVIYFVVFPPVIYVLAQQTRRTNDKRLLFFLVAAALGFFASSVFLAVGTTLVAGLNLGKGQPLFSIVDLDAPISRTGISLYLSPIFALSLWTLLFWKENDKRTRIFARVLALLILAVEAYWVLFIGNRAPLVSFGLVALIFWIIKIYESKSVTFRNVSIAVIVIAGIMAFLLVTGLVPDFIKKIPVFRRIILGGSDSARLNLYVQFFTNFWRYPFGGLFVCIDDYWIHMFWLDIYNLTGIVPFALFSYLLCVTGYRYVLSQRPLRFSRPSGNAMFACLLSIFALGLFEPLFSANPLTLIFFAALFGYAPKRTIGKLPRWRLTI